MTRSIMPAFQRNEYAAIYVGRLLAGYGELEFDLANCVSGVLGEDKETGFRVLFRAKGESARIDIADAILFPFYKAAGLRDVYKTFLGAMRHCKTIRNQYAHCHWLDRDGVVYFVDLDTPVKRETGIPLAFVPVTKELLKQQEEFFCYCAELLIFLSCEYLRRAGRLANHPWSIPAVMAEPPLHAPRDDYPAPLPDPIPHKLTKPAQDKSDSADNL